MRKRTRQGGSTSLSLCAFLVFGGKSGTYNGKEYGIMRKKNNMMCILRKSLSLMLSVFLCVSAFEGVFALDNDLMAQSDLLFCRI